ncbi:translocation/assembly module TamB domain-containing protein [Lacihabitans sp. CCS-44]|uniref:translocation/assembly module TamB domain-containing protein n=1 Tax=Lacihabitans sp. CCS-44 TaxID=2487331 RepID=UPI0020CE00AF|nr:translocation/assembly module TamB domain-containing protein [Lacihabitans sp. CCS-44]
MKRIFNILINITGIVVLLIVSLSILAYYSLQLPEVQTNITQKATEWLSEKVGGNVTISQARISWLDEITFEDINIKDLEGRDMIFVRELYVNCKTNFTFDLANNLKIGFDKNYIPSITFNTGKIFKFDNNLDYVLLKNPEVKLVKDKTGKLNIDYWIAAIEKIGKDSTKKSVPNQNKPFTIDNAYITNGNVSLSDARRDRFPDKTFDYYNFRFDKINANIENVLILGDTVAFKTTNLSAVDYRSDLKIKDIKTDFLYCKTAMLLDNLSAYINESYVGNKLHFLYERPSAFNDFFRKVKMNANLKNSILDSQDLGRFASDMYNYKERYILSAKMDGLYVDLNFKEFDLKFGTSSNLKGDVNFKGFPNLKKTNTTLSLKPSTMLAKDVSQYSKNPDFQKYIKKIEKLDFSGTFAGVYDNFKTKSELNALGLGKINGEMEVQIAADATYKGDLNIQQLDLGKLFDEPSLEKLSFQGKIDGTGFEVKSALLQLDGQVSEIGYNGYTYKNIIVDGNLGQSIFDGYIDIKDPNITAQVEGRADLNKELNTFKIKGLLENANLKPLGISKENLKIKSTINFDFIGNKLDDWIGRARFSNTVLENENHSLAVDSLYFNSGIYENQRRFSMVSEFFNIELNGNFVPSKIISDVGVLVKEYQLYFDETEENRMAYYKAKNIAKNAPANFYDANYRLYFKDSRRFFGFFDPNIYVSAGSILKGKFLSRVTSEFSLEGELDSVSYKGNEFYKSTIDFNTSKYAQSPEVLTSLILFSKNQKISNGILTENLYANAFWDQANTINFDASIDQQNSNSNIGLFGSVKFTPKGFDIRFNPKNSKVFLIDKKWTFSENNLINVLENKIVFNDLKLSNNNQIVRFNGIVSNDPKQESILTVQDFDLLTLKPFTNVETKGIANGELRLRDYYKNPLFTSNLHIENLEYRNSLIGTVTTEANWDNLANKLKINGSVFRQFEEIFRMNGYYDPEIKNNSLNLKAKVRNLNLQMFEGMLTGVMTNMTGLAEGDVEIFGTPLDPIFKGQININKGSLKVISSGTTIYFDDKVLLNEEGFVAAPEGITVRDAPIGGNSATIQGGVFNGGSGKFMVGLNASIKGSNGFKVLNLKSFESDVFYGTAFAGGDLQMTGDFENIVVTGNLNSKKGTKITIPMDSGKKIDLKQEGIPFLKKAEKIDSTLILKTKKPKIKTGGVKIAFNLSFTQDAECEIIFDRTNNDVLNVFGEGRLSILYDTRGDFTISGPYVVRSGKYNFSFQNLASLRKFNIVDGSRITWSGDPYDANLDLRANYTANIPIPSSISDDLANTSARFPVNVTVILSDRLLTPTIKYDINFDLKQIPIIGQSDLLGFEQKLRNDEQLLSRNVSSILVFNEIFPDNIAAAMAQEFLIDNVSNLLSNQIGNLANKLNPNLELGVQFGDFRENILNNMQLNFSYRFLNNRIKLSGKSSFINSLENNINATTTGQLSVGGELEYNLSQDGEYKFRLYSRSVPTNYYTFSSTGNVIVSGGNFIISRNFNSLLNNKKPKTFPLGVGKKEEVSMLKLDSTGSNFIK